MKFAICQELFEDLDWDSQCRIMSRLGYGGIEVAPFAIAPKITDLTAERRRVLKKTAEDHGLQIIGLHWLLAKTEGLHLTTSDAAVRRATAEYIIELGKACADLGGTLMVFGSPAQRNLQPGVTAEQALDHAAEVFRAAMPELAARGVSICMEPLTPKETNFINTCADAAQLIERVDHPLFVLHQDVKAMLGAESKSIPELIHEFQGRVGHFHVNDTNLLGPGMGETDYHPIIKALLDTQYDGWVSVEVFDYRPGAEEIARQSIEYLRRILDEVTGG
jgi:sugar phosphate isomerase/epimerase